MKPIPRRVIRQYMSILVACARSHDGPVLGDRPELAKLASRDDFDIVLDYLASANLIRLLRPDQLSPIITLTDEGYSFFEKRRDVLYRFVMNSIIVPILVSIITTILAVYILPLAGRQAEKYIQQSRSLSVQSQTTPSPADGLSGNP